MRLTLWGQNPKIGYQQCNGLQTPNLSKQPVCGRICRTGGNHCPYAFVNSPAAVIIRIGEDGVVLVHEVCATILWHGGSVRRDSLRRTSHEKNRSDHQTL